MLGMLLQAMYNIIDTIFIGMLGPKELAAIAITFPVVFVFIAMGTGLSVGSTILISQNIGAKKLKKASNAAEHSLLISTIIGIIVAIFGIVFSEPVFLFMGATSEILPMTLEYSRLIFIGFIFMFIGFIAQGILRAEGDSKTSFKINLIAIGLNIVLDPLLIFGIFGFPELGITGAAIATVISRIIGTTMILLYLYKGKAQTKICFNIKYFKFDTNIVKKIFSVGLPASLGNLMTSIGMILMMTLIGTFGSPAIAAYGVGLRIDSLVRMPIFGLMSAIVAITGQNIGANNIDRILKTAKIGIGIVLAVMIPITIIMISIPKLLFKIFSSNIIVIEIGAQYLSIVAFSYLFFGISMVLMGVLQGAGKTKTSAVIMALYWIIMIVLAYFLKKTHGLNGIWFGVLISAILISIIVGIVYKTKYWISKTKQKQQNISTH